MACTTPVWLGNWSGREMMRNSVSTATPSAFASARSCYAFSGS
jgi:hypothetical protein